jgi:alpha-ketoglutarate-dependent taurine dioxygenase
MEIPINQIPEYLETEPGYLKFKFPSEYKYCDNPASYFMEFSRKIGIPLSQNTKGETLLSVKDQGWDKNDPRTRGPNTNRKLSFHTDRCDVICFLCLQPAKSGGENQIVNSMEVENLIKQEAPRLHETLCQKFPYKTHTIDQANPLPYCEQPIFSWRSEMFACSYLRVLIDRADQDPQCPNLTELQKEALNFLDSVCEREELQVRFTLNKGDILLINNWTTLHRRTAFEDFEDENKQRHLLRIWLSMPNSRPLDPAFQANFGSVEAGVLRGGIKSIS